MRTFRDDSGASVANAQLYIVHKALLCSHPRLHTGKAEVVVYSRKNTDCDG